MNRNLLLLVSGIFIISCIPLYSQGLVNTFQSNGETAATTSASTVTSTQDTFPFGDANLDYNLIISHNQNQSNGPTIFSDETGKTIYLIPTFQ